MMTSNQKVTKSVNLWHLFGNQLSFVTLINILSTKASRQSTLGYTHGSSLSVDRCASYELDGDARHEQRFYLGSAAVWA